MSLTNVEAEAIFADPSKRISGDIQWKRDEDHSPALEFRADVESDIGWPLFIHGSYNPRAATLSYSLILRTEGRIYGLDLGKEHRNPDRAVVGEIHKHQWRDQDRDRWAYCPPDITASVDDPVCVWNQFCREASIQHVGQMEHPYHHEDLTE